MILWVFWTLLKILPQFSLGQNLLHMHEQASKAYPNQVTNIQDFYETNFILAQTPGFAGASCAISAEPNYNLIINTPTLC